MCVFARWLETILAQMTYQVSQCVSFRDHLSHRTRPVNICVSSNGLSSSGLEPEGELGTQGSGFKDVEVSVLDGRQFAGELGLVEVFDVTVA